MCEMFRMSKMPGFCLEAKAQCAIEFLFKDSEFCVRHAYMIINAKESFFGSGTSIFTISKRNFKGLIPAHGAMDLRSHSEGGSV